MKLLLILYALSVATMLVMCIYIFITEDMKNDMKWYSPIALIVCFGSHQHRCDSCYSHQRLK